MLGLAESKEKGLIVTKPDGSWDFQEGLKTPGGFIDKTMKGMAALALGRRATLVKSLLYEEM